MDEKQALLERISEKIGAIGEGVGLESRYVIDNSRAEIHISITSKGRMGKVHRNVREMIRGRVKKSRLRFYTVYLYLNPTDTGRACTAWVLRPKSDKWEVEPNKRLPAQDLVA